MTPPTTERMTTLAAKLTSAMQKAAKTLEDEEGKGAIGRRTNARLYEPSARKGQRGTIRIKSRRYQPGIGIPKVEARRYLEWLEAGNAGTVTDFRRATRESD